jgi:hypothetical protein
MTDDYEVDMLIASVRAGMVNGIVYRHPTTGDVLDTEEAIIATLVIEGGVKFDITKRVEATTTEAELAKMREKAEARA